MNDDIVYHACAQVSSVYCFILKTDGATTMKSELEPFYIEPLSWKNLRSALNLLSPVFPRESQGGERPFVFFTATLFFAGRLLLKRKGYPRLYTSTDPNEASAQLMYEQMGLKVYKDEDEPGTACKRLCRQIELSPAR